MSATQVCYNYARRNYLMDKAIKLEYSGLWTLEQRRNRAVIIFKIYQDASAAPFNDFFVLQSTTRTRGHKAKLVEKQMPITFETTFLL